MDSRRREVVMKKAQLWENDNLTNGVTEFGRIIDGHSFDVFLVFKTKPCTHREHGQNLSYVHLEVLIFIST